MTPDPPVLAAILALRDWCQDQTTFTPGELYSDGLATAFARCADRIDALIPDLRAALAPPLESDEIRKAWKLIEALAEPCAEGKPDHAWRKCRRCLAVAELDAKSARQLLIALVTWHAALAVAPPPEQKEEKNED